MSRSALPQLSKEKKRVKTQSQGRGTIESLHLHYMHLGQAKREQLLGVGMISVVAPSVVELIVLGDGGGGTREKASKQ